MGPPIKPGAPMRSLRRAAGTVAVFEWPSGTVSTSRSARGAPAVEARHVGLDPGPGLVDVDQARRIDANLTGSPAPDCRLCPHDPARAQRASFFERDADWAEEPADHRGVGLDPALGPRAIAKRLKRAVGLLGPRTSRKSLCGMSVARRWPPCPTGSREPSRRSRSAGLIATDSLISYRRSAARQLIPPRVTASVPRSRKS